MGKIRCTICNTILESKSRHDFKQCHCENGSYVDGGDNYTRVGGADIKNIEVWSTELNQWVRL